MTSAPQDQADFSEGRARFREDADTSGAVPHMVRRVILRDELDLLKLRVCREQASADLVDEVLDGATVEVVEDALDLIADGSRSEEAGAFGHAVLQIEVTPVHVHSNRERAIGELRKRCVVVPSERRERAAGRLHERDAFPTASRGGDFGSSANHVYGDLRD